MANHPEAVVTRILSAGNASRRDLADLSMVYGRLSGDQSSLMQLLAGIVQRALRVNLLVDVKDLYKDQSPSDVAKMMDEVRMIVWKMALCLLHECFQRKGGMARGSSGIVVAS